MKVKCFREWNEANAFAHYVNSQGFIVDGVYPPQKVGASGLMGKFVVWYH